MHSGCSQGEAAPDPSGSDRSDANTHGNAAGRQREGWRRTQQPTLNLQGKTKPPPSSKSTLALPGSQSHPQQYSREPHPAALQAINSNIRIKKEVPDRARFSDRQAGSQQHKHTEHGQTSALPPPPPHPCFLFIPIFSFFFSSHPLWLLSEGDLHRFTHGVFVSFLWIQLKLCSFLPRSNPTRVGTGAGSASSSMAKASWGGMDAQGKQGMDPTTNTLCAAQKPHG